MTTPDRKAWRDPTPTYRLGPPTYTKVLQYEIAPLLIRPVGRPPKRPVILYDDFWYRAESCTAGRSARSSAVAKVEWPP